MLASIGIAVVFVMVFGGYMAAGGKMGIILKSLPYELAMIGGAAVGAFLIANAADVVKHTISDVSKIFKGSKWKRDDYELMLCVMAELVKTYRTAPIQLERHIDDPTSSEILSKHPKLLSDQTALALVCDSFRSVLMNFDDPLQMEDMLEKRIRDSSEEAQHSSHALQTVADGLPALGIVAAVLGVIKTMASIDQPPEILGKLIGGALVGTFLGVFLSYGIVGPISSRLKAIADEEQNFLAAVKEIMVAALNGHSISVCIEVGRQSASHHLRPTFEQVDSALKEMRGSA